MTTSARCSPFRTSSPAPSRRGPRTDTSAATTRRWPAATNPGCPTTSAPSPSPTPTANTTRASSREPLRATRASALCRRRRLVRVIPRDHHADLVGLGEDEPRAGVELLVQRFKDRHVRRVADGDDQLVVDD